MMGFLDSIAWASALAVAVMMIVLTIGPYIFSRIWLRPLAGKYSERLSHSLISLTIPIHALILALVFAQQQVNTFDLRKTVAKESAAAADVFYDLYRYAPDDTKPLRLAIAEYVQVVINEEWETLVKGHLSQRAWDRWETVFHGVLNMTPQNPRQEALRDRMLHDLDTISETRNNRQADYASGVTSLFWLVVFAGIFIIVLADFSIQNRPLNLLFLFLFTAYNGIVIYTIMAMSNPYTPPGAVDPLPLLEIFQHDMIDLLAGG